MRGAVTIVPRKGCQMVAVSWIFWRVGPTLRRQRGEFSVASISAGDEESILSLTSDYFSALGGYSCYYKLDRLVMTSSSSLDRDLKNSVEILPVRFFRLSLFIFLT